MTANRGKAALFDEASFEVHKNGQSVQTAQGTHDTQDTHNAHITRYANRKQKHPRINMAFYDDNLDYLRDAAWKAKMSVTEYVNGLIRQDRGKNANS